MKGLTLKFQYKVKNEVSFNRHLPHHLKFPSFPRGNHRLYVFLCLKLFNENIFTIPCVIIKTTFVF